MGESSAATRVLEKKIIARVLAGEKDEFRLLVLAHQERVFAVVMRAVANQTVAKELTQEAFVRAYFSLQQFRFQSSFSTWLIRIALNLTSSYFSSREFKEHVRTTSLDNINYQEIPAAHKSEHYDDEAVAKLHAVVARLRPKLRDVFVLCALEQMSYQEAADILTIPVGTVRSRLNKARLMIRQMYFEA